MRIRYAGREFSLTGASIDWKKEQNGMTLLAREVL